MTIAHFGGIFNGNNMASFLVDLDIFYKWQICFDMNTEQTQCEIPSI